MAEYASSSNAGHSSGFFPPAWYLCLLLFVLPVPVIGADGDILVLDFENDWFAGSDRYYTNGLRLAWIRPMAEEPDWMRGLSRQTPLFRGEGRQGIYHAIGQNVYTPGDDRTPDPDPEDRPYAGWLYGTLGAGKDTGRRLERLQLTLGVVGPASLAEWSQKAIHEATGSDAPQGWDHQLGNEPTLMLSYEHQWRGQAQGIGDSGLSVDWSPYLGGHLGTPFTFLNAGLVWRLGRNLPMDYGPPRIHPGISGSGLFEPRPGFHWYAFFGLDLRIVAHDLFLDGNNWRDSPSVDKEPYVGDARLGVVVTLDRWRLAYTHVLRSREFETQRSRQSFGSLSISWIY